MKHFGICAVLAAAFAAGCGPSPEDIRTQAVSKIQLGHVDEAKQLFQRVLDRRPSDPVALYHMGRIAQTEGFHEQAVYYFQCCLDAAPGFYEARDQLDEARRQAGAAGDKLMFIP